MQQKGTLVEFLFYYTLLKNHLGNAGCGGNGGAGGSGIIPGLGTGMGIGAGVITISVLRDGTGTTGTYTFCIGGAY